MNMRIPTTSLLFAAFLCGIITAPIHAQEKRTNDKAPSALNDALRKGDFFSLDRDLTEKIKAMAEGKTLPELLENKEFVYLTTIADVIRTTGVENVSELYKKDRKYAQFLEKFLKDEEWMALYLGAGAVPSETDAGLRVLGDIWAEDGNSPDFRKYLSLTTGIAAAWGKGRLAEDLQYRESLDTTARANPVWRYNFFKKSHQENKLHPNFMNLKPWEIRFVAGNGFDDASIEYAQNLINLPAYQYVDACWRADYRGTSIFGDTVQGPFFHAPWAGTKGNAQLVVENGGVCGGLSTLGATAAASRGIPSYTVGQPGHCAYAIRPERGKWEGGFGGPHGGPHNYIFPGTDPTNMRLMEAAFASDEKVERAAKAVSIARALDKADMTDLAKSAWGQALKETPLNLFYQKDFQEFALRNNLYTPQQWVQYAQAILKGYDGHGFAAIQVLEDVNDKVMEGLGSDAQKLAWYGKVNESLAHTPASWAVHITPVLEAERASLSEPQSAEKLMAMAIDKHLNNGDGTNFGKTLEWAITNFAQNNGDAFTKAFEAAAANQGQGANEEKGKPAEKKIKDAFGKAIIAAENARSMSAVRAIAAVASKYSRGSGGPKESDLDCPDGELVSDKGYLRLSSSAYDDPCEHIDVLSRKGGRIHTGQEEIPHVIVELPDRVNVSGMLIAKTNGNEGRMKKMRVSRSVDGATWFPVVETEDMPKQWRIDLKEDTPARWIKVESINPPGKKEYMHLSHILVFKKK